MRAPSFAAAIWFCLAGAVTALAQSQAQQPAVRVENGVRYRETRATVGQPVRDVRYVDQQQTCYQQRYRTDVQQQAYTTYVPVTQYECVARLHDWWRIFREPYVAYHLEPYTTWQPRTQTVSVPVTRREIVPYTRTVRVAVPQLRFEDREQVAWVPVGPASEPASEPPRRLASASVPDRSVGERPADTSRDPTTFVPVPRAVASPAPRVATNDPYNSHAFPSGAGLSAPPLIPQSNRVPYRPASPAPGRYGYGGVARLDGDPPRYGTNASTETWQARRK